MATLTSILILLLPVNVVLGTFAFSSSGSLLKGSTISLVCAIPTFTGTAVWKNSAISPSNIHSCSKSFCLPSNGAYPRYAFSSTTNTFTITITGATLDDDTWTCEQDTPADSGTITLGLQVPPTTCTLTESGGTYTCTLSCGNTARGLDGGSYIKAKLNGTTSEQGLSPSAITNAACTSPESAYSAIVPTSFFTQDGNLSCECGASGYPSTAIESNSLEVTAPKPTAATTTTTTPGPTTTTTPTTTTPTTTTPTTTTPTTTLTTTNPTTTIPTTTTQTTTTAAPITARFTDEELGAIIGGTIGGILILCCVGVFYYYRVQNRGTPDKDDRKGDPRDQRGRNKPPRRDEQWGHVEKEKVVMYHNGQAYMVDPKDHRDYNKRSHGYNNKGYQPDAYYRDPRQHHTSMGRTKSNDHFVSSQSYRGLRAEPRGYYQSNQIYKGHRSDLRGYHPNQIYKGQSSEPRGYPQRQYYPSQPYNGRNIYPELEAHPESRRGASGGDGYMY